MSSDTVLAQWNVLNPFVETVRGVGSQYRIWAILNTLARESSLSGNATNSKSLGFLALFSKVCAICCVDPYPQVTVCSVKANGIIPAPITATSTVTELGSSGPGETVKRLVAVKFAMLPED